jgi:hypothetical protein
MRARSRWAGESPSLAGVAPAALCAWLEPSTGPKLCCAGKPRFPATAPTFGRAQHSSTRNIDGDMLRATYCPVAGFPDLGVLRPVPTAARPPHPFPVSPVIGAASLPATPKATGPRRLSQVPRTTIRTFNAQYAGGFLSARSWNQNAFHGLRRHDNGSAPSWPHPKAGESMTTLTQASLHVADRTIASARSAPGLSTTHGGIATRDPGVSPDRTHTGRPP